MEALSNGKHSILTTEQQSVAFMFDKTHGSKIKNDEMMRWRIEQSTYDFDIKYQCGQENVADDALSRINCFKLHVEGLHELLNTLCNLGVTRMTHFVKVRNLPFSVDDIKRMTAFCKICLECKPKFFKSDDAHLIKATQPFERLNLDFKGPLPSNDRNKCILMIVNKYSRFPLAFLSKDVSGRTIISHLRNRFSIFAMRSFIHSDCGSGFMSAEVKVFLTEKGIAKSRTTSYNSSGNGLVKRMDGTVWKADTLALKSHQLPMTARQEVLDNVSNSVRSLLCTAISCTLRERMFAYQRKTTNGTAVPSWMAYPGPVLLKRYNRSSKFDPLVEEVELLEANPQYAQVKFSDGREI